MFNFLPNRRLVCFCRSLLVILVLASLVAASWAQSQHSLAKAVLAPAKVTAATITQSALEIVTTQGAVTTTAGNAGNVWGGHQARIVRTSAGVFTAYLVGNNPLASEWRLAQRRADGSWPVIASGVAGREPVNLLAAPDGTLYVIGWPNGTPTIWSGKPANGTVTMTKSVIPGLASGNWPYASAGIDDAGNLCVLNSNETFDSNGVENGGMFDWACYGVATKQWVTQQTQFDLRYAYTYVFPHPTGRLSLVSTRDVRWSALGYTPPAGDELGYVFNAIRYWRTPNLTTTPLQVLSYAEEPQTPQYLDVRLNAQMDAYLDTQDRMHILYVRKGASTGGVPKFFHRIVGADGQTIFDGEIQRNGETTMGWQTRIFQDGQGQFYLLSAYTGQIFPLSADGITLGEPVQLNTGGYTLAYTGFHLAAPRTGTRASNVVDIVFGTEDETKWLYFSINLPGATTPNLIQNGDFSQGVASWHGGLEPTGSGLTVQNGELCLAVPTTAQGGADAQMAQYGVPLENGQRYQVRFDMMATVNKTVTLIVGTSQAPWLQYLQQAVALTPTRQSFSYEFTMNQPTALNNLLTFHLGGGPAATVCLDNVVVQKVNAATPPSAPANLQAAAVSTTQINLSWSDTSQNETGFKLERCQGAGCTNFAQIATVGANVTTFQNTGLKTGITYSYRVRAASTLGDSAYSNSATAATVTLPTAPNGAAATTVSSAQINLTWTDKSTNESGFVIERCQGSGCTNFSQIGTTAANIRSYGDPTLAANTLYCYRVRAYNSAGNSAPSNSACRTTGPVPPTTLTANRILATEANLFWVESAVNESGFKLERCTGAACTNFVQIALLPANGIGYHDSGLTANTTYRYRVNAYNGNGNSLYSNLLDVTTPAAVAAAVLDTPATAINAVMDTAPLYGASPHSTLTLTYQPGCFNPGQVTAAELLVGGYAITMTPRADQAEAYQALLVVDDRFAADQDYLLQVQWRCPGVDVPLTAPLGLLQVLPDTEKGTLPQRTFLPLITGE